jgi:hypothetical protein
MSVAGDRRPSNRPPYEDRDMYLHGCLNCFAPFVTAWYRERTELNANNRRSFAIGPTTLSLWPLPTGKLQL